MVSPPALASAALVAATLLLAACQDLLPGRAQAPPATSAAVDSARAAAARRRSKAPPTPPREATGAEAEAAFRDISQTLRRLVVAQQGFYAENGAYSGDLSRLGIRPAGASEVDFLWVDKDGVGARGTHPALPGRDCVTYTGPASPPPSTRRYRRSGREGVIVCDNDVPARPARPSSARPAPAGPTPRSSPAGPAPRSSPDTVRAALDTTSALSAVSPMVQMRVDLRKLGEAQTAYFGTQGVYSRRVEMLQLQYGWQRGVAVSLLYADQRSWAARATHTARPGKSCVVWYGSPPTRPATQAQRKVPERSGVPVCDE